MGTRSNENIIYVRNMGNFPEPIAPTIDYAPPLNSEYTLSNQTGVMVQKLHFVQKKRTQKINQMKGLNKETPLQLCSESLLKTERWVIPIK